MNLEELHIELKRLGVPDERYYLHGLYGAIGDSGKMALSIKKGKYSIEYEVYYNERGEKNSIRVFESESEACDYFLNKLSEAILIEKVQNISGLNAMTVNERLYVSGLMDEFDKTKKKNKARAAQILRILKVDELSIGKIFQ